MRTLGIDIETFSSVSLPSCGVHRYVEAPDFTILLFGYAFDDEPVVTVDFAKGEELPQEVLDALWDKDVEKTAFNAPFERTCIGAYFGRYCPPEQWFDTLVLASCCGLPLSLEAVGEAMELGEDKAKLRVGKQLIREFSIPCKPTKKNGMSTRVTPDDDPENWGLYKTYNIRDVETEREIRKRLLRWRPSLSEQRFWCLDQQINDRGIRVDVELAEHAIEIGEGYKARLIAKAQDLSGLVNPNSASQVKLWLEEQEGLTVPSLNKKVIADVVAQLPDGDAKAFMNLRAQFSKSSTKKYEAVTRSVCADGHIHGCFQFAGAGRTGRFAGRLMQLQNLPQNHMEDLDSARWLVKENDAETFELIYPDAMSTLSELIRTTLIPEEGQRFIVADFSAIEARVVAWIAGEEWRLKVFEEGGDIYCASASQMFKVPVVKHGVNGHLRQKGKVAELACVAENSLVLTDIGLVPIQYVTRNMRVWDGKEWVRHGGAVRRGIREVITYEGLTATPDHLVWVEGERRPVRFGVAAASGAHLVQTGDGWSAVRVGESNQPGEAMERDVEPLPRKDGVHGLWQSIVGGFRKSTVRSLSWLSALLEAKTDTAVVRPEISGGEAAMYESEGRRVRKVRSAWDKVQLRLGNIRRSLHDTYTRLAREVDGDRQDRLQRALRAGQSEMGDTSDKPAEQTELGSPRVEPGGMAVCSDRCGKEAVIGDDKGRGSCRRGACGEREAKELARHKGMVRYAPVYDIANAGPRHRYTVSNVLVHNCGYGGGVNALKAFGADKAMTEEEMVQTVDHWREASPHICALWKSLEQAAIRCVVRGTPAVSTVGNIRFEYDSPILWMTLPSGRRIAYWGAAYTESSRGYGKCLSYMGVNQTTRKWERIETWGGKLVENCVQSTARDCLKESMLALNAAGFDIRAHVHDEVIITAPPEKTVEEACEIMGRELPWAKGLPLRADGYECTSYRKD